MKFNSMQSQLFVAFGSAVVVISLFYSYLTYLAVEVSEQVTAAFLLETEAGVVPQRYPLAGLAAAPSYDFYQYIIDAAQLPDCDTRLLPHDAAIMVFSCPAARYYAYRTIGADSKPLWLLLNATEVLPLSRFDKVLSVLFISVALLTTAVAVLLIWWLTSRLARPMQLLTRAVLAQSDRAPGKIEGSARKDEIGQLARAFELSYGELQQALRRERDFTNDVSHELRTPITLIKNTLTLYPQQPLNHDAMQLLQQASAELQQTVDVLLALARKENLQFSRQPLLPILEQVVLSVHHLYPEQGFDVEVQVAADFHVNGNSYLISLLCQNLVNNGFYHGAGQGMTIYQAEHDILFENPCGDQARSEYYQGLGHGLYLVTRIVGALGWQLKVEQTSERYRVRLTPDNAV